MDTNGSSYRKHVLADNLRVDKDTSHTDSRQCICIRWTGSGVDIWSSRRLFETVDTPQANKCKTRRSQQRTQINTISKNFHPIQAATPRKREGQGQTGNSSKVKSRKLNTPLTEEPENSDNEYEHRQKKGP